MPEHVDRLQALEQENARLTHVADLYARTIADLAKRLTHLEEECHTARAAAKGLSQCVDEWKRIAIAHGYTATS